MKTVCMKRITIIGDITVQYRILNEVQEFGATGYTSYPVQGKGQRGVRPRHAEPANAKIEVVATQEVAHRILEHLSQHYFEKYAMIAFIDEVEVLRGEKFAPAVPKG